MRLRELLRKNEPIVKIFTALAATAVGFGIGLLFWKNSSKNFEFENATANTAIKWMILSSFALGCGFIPVVRCVVMITLITLLNVDGQSIVQCALMGKLAETIGQNLVTNFQQATNSVLCNIDVAKNVTRSKMDLLQKPSQEVMDDLLQGADRSSRVGDAMPRLVRRLENELTKIAKGGNLEEMEERSANVDEEERRMRKNKKKQTDAQIEKSFKKRLEIQSNKTNKIREKMLQQFVEKSTYQCKDIVNGAVFLCKEWFLRKLEECQASKWAVVCMIYEFDFFCNFFEVLDFRFEKCGSENTQIEEYATVYGNQLAIADNWTKNLANEFHVDLQYKVDYPFRMPHLVTLEQMLIIVREAFGGIKQLLNYMAIILSFTGFVFVIMAFKLNFNWFKSYETDVTHENVYLTPTWWLINKRRKGEDRSTLLPLMPFEKKRVRSPVTLNPTINEQKQLLRGISKMCYIFIVAFSLITMDSEFHEMLTSAKEYSGVEIKQEGKHEIKVQISGIGTVAKMVSSIIEDIDKSFTLNQIINNAHCVVNPVKTDKSDVTYVWLMFALLFLQSTLGVYLIRLRIIVASIVFPTRQRTRVIWLYNDMLRQRALYHRQRKININQMALKDEFPAKSWLDKKLGQTKCLWCLSKVKGAIRSCWKHAEPIYFCLTCWKEQMNEKCCACTMSKENIQNKYGRIKKKYRQMGNFKST